MKRQRDRGSLQVIPSGRRGGRRRGGRGTLVADQATVGPVTDGSALALLSEVLIGDSPWTMAEVRGLIWMRELAARGRWNANGLDDEEADPA